MSEWAPYIWFDGKIVPFEEAKIHVMTYSLHYGVGVFEGIRSYKTDDEKAAIFRLRDHIKRLFDSAKTYKLELPYSEKEIEEAIIELIKISNFKECYIRPIAFINITKLGVKPETRVATLAIGMFKWGKYLGKSYYEGAKVTVSAWRRIPPNALPMTAKAIGNYLNSYLASIDAKLKGFDEAIMLDTRGFVSEGPGQNVFMIKNSKAYTPPLNASVLPGVTRETIITLLRNDLDIETVERDISLGELFTADEIFYTGTAVEVTPIVEIDGIKIGEGRPGDITKKLQKLYEDVVRGRVDKYRSWLTIV